MAMNLSSKRVQINKANSMIILIVSLAAVITAFSLVSTRALISQRGYQGRVLSEQKTARDLSKHNVQAVNELKATYESFNNGDSQGNNIIGGSTTSVGPKSGDNTKLILDALPSQYDFPALISSLESILRDPRYKLEALAGTDLGDPDPNSPLPEEVVEIPFNISISSNYKSTQDLIMTLDKVIRPISIETMQISGAESDIELNITAKTYWKPGKTLNITSKVVK